MNHVKTLLCSHFLGIDKLERLKLLQGDPLIDEFGISVREPEMVSRFLGNFSYKTTQMLREINFKVFRKLLDQRKLTSITIGIDSSVVNVEGHQEGTANIKTKEYPTLVSQVTGQSVLFVTGEEGRETVELFTKQNTWGKDRRYEKRGNA